MQTTLVIKLENKITKFAKVKATIAAFLLTLAAMACMAPVRANPIHRFAKNLSKNNKGFTQVLVSVIVVVVVAILITVSAIILSMFGSAAGNISGLSSQANETISQVQNTGYGSLNLLSIVEYVLAAVAIIGAIMGIFVFFQSRR